MRWRRPGSFPARIRLASSESCFPPRQRSCRRPLPKPEHGMPDAAQLAQDHWNETPLFLTEEERYSIYPWLCDAAEFRKHAGERVLEIGCGTGRDLLQFAKHGAIATGVDLTARHVELARERVGDLAVIPHADMRHLPFEDGSFDYVY